MSYKYCPYCKGKLNKKDRSEYTCKSCGEKLYINPAPCVSVIPIRKNKILLTKRGIEPRKGAFDFVGGFVDIGETTEKAVMRETKEETGLTIKVDKYLGQYLEVYRKDTTYSLCFLYTVKITKGKEKPQDDVKELIWVDIDKIKDLNLRGSFPGAIKILNSLKKVILSGI